MINLLVLIGSYFTPDTYANEHSARAARLAAGLCADLASTILSGRAKNGFALVWVICHLHVCEILTDFGPFVVYL